MQLSSSIGRILSQARDSDKVKEIVTSLQSLRRQLCDGVKVLTALHIGEINENINDLRRHNLDALKGDSFCMIPLRLFIYLSCLSRKCKTRKVYEFQAFRLIMEESSRMKLSRNSTMLMVLIIISQS